MIHRVSKIFWPQSVIPKDASLKPTSFTSKTQKLMLELGLIKSIGTGLYQMTPLIQRVLDKLINHLNVHMERIGGQKVTLSVLTPASLWEKSGRINEGVSEIFLFKDRQEKSYLLSPTHEETITSLLAQSYPISYKQLPIKLFQIGLKFRDELKPRLGLLRTKEFLMKDLYSFDKNLEDAENTYKEIGEQYAKFFNSLEFPWIKVKGATGIMGGCVSHEYHILSTIGEDSIKHCVQCQFSVNDEIFNLETVCPCCGGKDFSMSKGMEIGHTFLLKDKYSQPLEANFLNKLGKPENMIMGSYGIGVTRLIAAALENFSTEHELNWPTLIAPFDICIISAKHGSIEENQSEIILNRLLNEIISICGSDSVLLDDRNHLTIGKRLRDSKRMGYPNIIVIGSKVLNDPPGIEFHNKKDGTVKILDYNEIIENLNKIIKYKNSLKLI